MRYEAKVQAFDVLDQIWITIRLWSTEGVDPAVSTPVLELQVSVAGQGESDCREWLRDALVAGLEAL